MAKVLILEDDLELGVHLQAAMEMAGHRVSLYPTAEAAIQAFEADPVDAVVSDIIIRKDGQVAPDGGLSAIWRIKQIAVEQRRKVFVVAISGTVQTTGMSNILTTADQFGADASLPKPFDPRDLIYLIEKGLETRHQ